MSANKFRALKMLSVSAIVISILFTPVYSEAATVTYNYDELNRLVMTVCSDGTKIITIEYEYDGAGNITSIDVQEDLVGTISGRITDSRDNPIPDIPVDFHVDKCSPSIGGTQTDGNGDFTIYGIPAGSVYIATYARSEGQNYIDKWWDGSTGNTDCEQATPITVVPGSDTGGINMLLELGGSVSGRITDGPGQSHYQP